MRFINAQLLFVVCYLASVSGSQAANRIGVGGSINDINGELAAGYSLKGGGQLHPFWDYEAGWSHFGKLDTFGGNEKYWAIHGAIKPKYPIKHADLYLLLGMHYWSGYAPGKVQLQYGLGIDQQVAPRLVFSGEYKFIKIHHTDIESLNFTLSYLF